MLIATVALSFDVLGEGFSAGSGPWCWIKDCESIKPSPIFWMLITGKAWEIAAYLGIPAIYIVLKCQQYCRYRKVGILFIKILNIELLIEMNDFSLHGLFFFYRTVGFHEYQAINSHTTLFHSKIILLTKYPIQKTDLAFCGYSYICTLLESGEVLGFLFLLVIMVRRIYQLSTRLITY